MQKSMDAEHWVAAAGYAFGLKASLHKVLINNEEMQMSLWWRDVIPDHLNQMIKTNTPELEKMDGHHGPHMMVWKEHNIAM